MAGGQFPTGTILVDPPVRETGVTVAYCRVCSQARDLTEVLTCMCALRTHESTRKPARRVEAGTARIRSATLSHQRGRWHVAFSVEVDEHVAASSGTTTSS